MRRRLGLLGVLALLVTACGGGSGAAAPPPKTGPPKSGPPISATTAGANALPRTTSTAACGWRSTSTYRHVVWIWMENRTYSAVLGSNGAAPQLSSYARRCGLATNYRAITHPSLPNYLAATSGSTGGVSSDCAPSACPQARRSLFAQVQAAGKQWRSYEDSMPGTCGLAVNGRYAPKHNPAVYFTPVRSRCRTWDVPMGGRTGAFGTALAHRTLPSFAFVTPDLCHDGHDCTTSTADTWLGTWLGRIVASPAYRAGDTAVFVTWDEGEGSDQHIATVVIAPTVRPGLRVATGYNHYSLLRTTEELLGLGRLGAAVSARSMRTAFHL